MTDAGVRSEQRLSPIVVGLALFGLAGAVRAGDFAEGDTFWQIQTGADIRSRHTVFLTDTFTWSMAGRPWHANSWLFDVLMSVAYDVAGRIGLGLFTLCCIALVGVSVAIAARALGARAGALAVTAALLLYQLMGWLSARPQTLTYALLPAVTLLAGRLVDWRGRRLAAGLAGLYLLVALWVNLHLAALAALPAVAVGLAALLLVHRRRWRELLPTIGAALVIIVLGCASSPFGLGVFGSAVATRDASSAVITEWAPLWETPSEGVATWMAAAVATALTGLAWRRRRRDRLLPVWTGAVVVLLLGGVDAARFSAMALVLAMPAVAVWATDIDWNGGRNRWRLAFVARGVAGGFAVVLLVAGVVRLPNFGRPTPAHFPTDATVQAIPAGCRVLNEYNDGGYLILRRTADGVRVALDGRNDVYGTELILHLEGLIHAQPGALAELDRDDVHCLLLNPHRPLVKLAEQAGWHATATDRRRVLLLSPGLPTS